MYINNIFIVYDNGWDWVVYLKSVENVITLGKLIGLLLPARASEQGNVIRSVRIYNILNIQPFRVEYRDILYPR